MSVGNHTYLALAKGGLVPEHLLILPITHFQSTSDLEDDCREGKYHQYGISTKKCSLICKYTCTIFYKVIYTLAHHLYSLVFKNGGLFVNQIITSRTSASHHNSL